MPIRTNRGRAAVYRKLWGWPMRSPGHLVVVLVVVAALVIAISLIVPQLLGSGGRAGDRTGASAGTSETTTANGDPSDGDGAPPVTGGANSATTDLPTRITSPPEHPTTAAPAADALAVAEKWGQAWVHHPKGISNAQWLAGLRPYTTDEYLVEMSTVDPDNIPATKLTGPPVPKESYTSSVTANLPTNGGTIAVTVIKTPAGWRVAYYEQVA